MRDGHPVAFGLDHADLLADPILHAEVVGGSVSSTAGGIHRVDDLAAWRQRGPRRSRH